MKQISAYENQRRLKNSFNMMFGGEKVKSDSTSRSSLDDFYLRMRKSLGEEKFKRVCPLYNGGLAADRTSA